VGGFHIFDTEIDMHKLSWSYLLVGFHKQCYNWTNQVYNRTVHLPERRTEWFCVLAFFLVSTRGFAAPSTEAQMKKQ
jgi:hypothetical protein